MAWADWEKGRRAWAWIWIGIGLLVLGGLLFVFEATRMAGAVIVVVVAWAPVGIGANMLRPTEVLHADQELRPDQPDWETVVHNRFTNSRADLIEALRSAGHQPTVSVENPNKDALVAVLSCERCGRKYFNGRSRMLQRLSPDKPCRTPAG